MYDRVRFWIDRFELEVGVYDSLSSTLSNVTDRIDRATGEVQTTGMLCNLNVWIKGDGVQVTGSLSRFFHWEKDNGKRGNLYPLNRHDTQEAVKLLSLKLGGVPMERAKVRALEFGSFIPVGEPVADCLKRFGNYPRLERVMRYGDSLSYRHRGKHKPKELVFYDKRADARAKGYEFPTVLGNFNLLKYELRLSGSIGKQLKWGEVTGSTLYDREFYKRLTMKYKEEFMRIGKIPQTGTATAGLIKSVGDSVEVLLSRLIRESGVEVIDSYVEELKGKGTFTDRANYSRLKKKLASIVAKTSTGEDMILNELIDGVENMCAYV